MQSEAVQDYVKQIYLLQARSDEPATTNEIAEKMGVSAAAATAMVKKLAELGLVEHRPYHGAQLTDAGNRVARRGAAPPPAAGAVPDRARWGCRGTACTSRRNGSSTCCRRSSRRRSTGRSATRTPIRTATRFPTADLRRRPRPAARGSRLEPGDDCRDRRVPDDAPLLRYLASLGMVPEARVRMVDKAPFDGPVSLEVDGIGSRWAWSGGADPGGAGHDPRSPCRPPSRPIAGPAVAVRARAAGAAVPGPGLRCQRGLHGSRQLRDQHPGRRRLRLHAAVGAAGCPT